MVAQGGVNVGVLGEGALGLLMQQSPVKVVDYWADVNSPEHERWTNLVHFLLITLHRTYDLGYVLAAH